MVRHAAAVSHRVGRDKKELTQQFRKSVFFNKLFREATLYESSPGQSLGNYCFQKLNKFCKLNIVIPDKYKIDAVISEITNANVARAVRSVQLENANSWYAYMTTLGEISSKSD